MRRTFNLVDEPWIPCRRLDGTQCDLSLRETLLKSHELEGVDGEVPPLRATLLRTCLAVMHRAIGGPRSLAEWRSLWKAGKLPADRVEAYMRRWNDRFDLFDSTRPFMQDGTFSAH